MKECAQLSSSKLALMESEDVHTNVQLDPKKSHVNPDFACKWKMQLSFRKVSKVWEVTSDTHEHTCPRTTASQAHLQIKSRKILQLSTAKLAVLSKLLELRVSTQVFREQLIKLTKTVGISSLEVFNTKRQVKRFMETHQSSSIDASESDQNMRYNLIAEAMEAQKFPLEEYLKSRQTDGYLRCFKIWNRHDRPIGIFWMSNVQFRFAIQYSDVLFVDAKAMGHTSLNWPYWSPTVIDQENTIHSIAHALTAVESDESCSWILQFLKDAVPNMKKLLRTVFTDGGTEAATINAIFPSDKHFLCAMHPTKIIIPKKVSKSVCSAFVERIRDDIIRSVDEEACKAAIEALTDNAMYRDAMAKIDWWIERVHQWAGFARARHFTLMRIGNATAESMFAKFDAWMDHETMDPVLLAKALERQESNDLLLEGSRYGKQLLQSMKFSDATHSFQHSMASKFSLYARGEFHAQYRRKIDCQVIDVDGDCIFVKCQGHQFMVDLGEPSSCSCSYPTQMGIFCMHLLCALEHKNLPIDMNTMSSRWALRTEVFTGFEPLPEGYEIVDRSSLEFTDEPIHNEGFSQDAHLASDITLAIPVDSAETSIGKSAPVRNNFSEFQTLSFRIWDTCSRKGKSHLLFPLLKAVEEVTQVSTDLLFDITQDARERVQMHDTSNLPESAGPGGRPQSRLKSLAEIRLKNDYKCSFCGMLKHKLLACALMQSIGGHKRHTEFVATSTFKILSALSWSMYRR
jgi:hypothetical protein